MREANFSNIALNRASIVITNNMYDRRALDSTSTLPLTISLSNLLTLCNASKKIREQIAKDGAIEQLVCILKNRKYRNMQNKIWSMAFRCLAVTAIRGNGKIRRKIIYSGTIPIIIDRLLLQFQNVVEHIQKEQIEMYLSYQTESPQLISGNDHSDSSVNENNENTSNASYINDEVNVNAPLLCNSALSTSPKYQNYLYKEIALSTNDTLLSPLKINGRRRRRSSGGSSYCSLLGASSPQGNKSQQELLSFYCYKQNIVKYMWHHVKKQDRNGNGNGNGNGNSHPNGHGNLTMNNTTTPVTPTPTPSSDISTPLSRNSNLDNIREENSETIDIQEGTNNLNLIANPIPQPQPQPQSQPIPEIVDNNTMNNSEMMTSNTATVNPQSINGNQSNVYKILNLSEVYPSIFKKLKFSVDDFVLALKMIACTCKYSDIRNIMSHHKLGHTERDIYQLIEFFTTSSHPPEIRYWATIIMRNAFKKNSQNLRMCSNLNCLKMESYPREFSKCGRCQVNAYCSRECQKAAWITGHRHWCVDHSTIQQFNSAAAANAAYIRSNTNININNNINTNANANANVHTNSNVRTNANRNLHINTNVSAYYSATTTALAQQQQQQQYLLQQALSLQRQQQLQQQYINSTTTTTTA